MTSIPEPPPLAIQLHVETYAGVQRLSCTWKVPVRDLAVPKAGFLLAFVCKQLGKTAPVRMLMDGATGCHLDNARIRTKLAAAARQPVGPHAWLVLLSFFQTGSIPSTVWLSPSRRCLKCSGNGLRMHRPPIITGTLNAVCHLCYRHFAGCPECAVVDLHTLENTRLTSVMPVVGSGLMRFKSTDMGATWTTVLSLRTNAATKELENLYLHTLGNCFLQETWTVGNVRVALQRGTFESPLLEKRKVTRVEAVVPWAFNKPTVEIRQEDSNRRHNMYGRCRRCRKTFGAKTTWYDYTDRYTLEILGGAWLLQDLHNDPDSKLKFEHANANQAVGPSWSRY